MNMQCGVLVHTLARRCYWRDRSRQTLWRMRDSVTADKVLSQLKAAFRQQPGGCPLCSRTGDHMHGISMYDCLIEYWCNIDDLYDERVCQVSQERCDAVLLAYLIYTSSIFSRAAMYQA